MASSAKNFFEKKLGPMTIGKLIRAYRTTNDLSAEALAQKLEVTRSFISNIEGGRKHLSLDLVVKFASELEENVDLYAMIWFEEEARKSGLDFVKIAKMKVA